MAHTEQPQAGGGNVAKDFDINYSAMQPHLNGLIPWCSVGCCSLFLDINWPGCFGAGFVSDCCCCSAEESCCRILCTENDCCQSSGNCDLMQTPSHLELKRTPNDWFTCKHQSYNCGECRTLLAWSSAECCCEQRLAIPTNSVKYLPWMINICGLTVMYQWQFPFTCFDTIESIKDKTLGTPRRLSKPHLFAIENLLKLPSYSFRFAGSRLRRKWPVPRLLYDIRVIRGS